MLGVLCKAEIAMLGTVTMKHFQRHRFSLLRINRLLRRCGCRFQHKSAQTALLHQLRNKIKTTGAISVSEYMKEVLTNPSAGYYMHRDVFGEKGDFITSPEISQMFGELIGIWCVNEWMQCGSPDKLQVVELGPGRGTLADDMLRVFSQFPGIKDAVSLHLVEVSPKLTQMQEEKLTGRLSAAGDSSTDCDHPGQRSSTSKYGMPVSWYQNVNDVPRGLTFYVAHEFFDALPIHKFQKQDGRWCEVLIDVDDSDSSPHHLRYTVSSGENSAVKLLFKHRHEEHRDHVELCPEGALICQQMAQRISSDGGFALIADYGHNGEKSDTFRAFREHKLFDALAEPGTADLTADVDFSYLQRFIPENVKTYGPVTQESFLHNMGIGMRLQKLLGSASPAVRKSLITGYDMLTNPEKMGQRFKFYALLQHREDPDYKPAGFIPPH